MLTSVLLALVAPAGAGGLTVTQPQPGYAGRDNVIRIAGAAPGAELLLFAGRDVGIHAPPECPNLQVGINNPARVPTPIFADDSGQAAIEYHVPSKFAGRTILLQAVEVAGCTESPLFVWDLPPSNTLLLGAATARMFGVNANDRAGTALALAGDVDGDDIPDILVGAYGADDGPASNAGATYLIRGPVSGDLDLGLAHARLRGEADGDWSGISVSGVGDTNGDGFDDILIGSRYSDLGAPNSGAAHLVLGPVSGDLSLSQADARLIGENADDGAGYSLDGAGDVNGDGLADLIVGAQYNDTSGSNAGIAYLLLGPVAGDIDLSTADARLFGQGNNDGAGRPVAGAHDLDGDGFDDLLVTAPFNDAGATNAGVAYIVLGPVPGDRSLGSADARLIGTEEKAVIDSVASPGDINGDGLPDFVVGSEKSDRTGEDAGTAWVVYSPFNGDVRLDQADATIEGQKKGDLASAAVAGAGDLDGDLIGDLFVGAVGADDSGAQSGTTYVILGPVWGAVELASANLRLSGEVQFDEAGGALAAGNLDGDGIPDLLVGASGSDLGGSDAGAVYLFSGFDLPL